MILEIVEAAVLLLLAGSSLFLWRSNRRLVNSQATRTDAEATRTDAETHLTDAQADATIVGNYELFLTRQNDENEFLRAEIRSLRERVAQLEAANIRQAAEHDKERISMDARLTALEKENRRLRTWAGLLFTQVVEAGHEPIPLEQVPEHP